MKRTLFRAAATLLLLGLSGCQTAPRIVKEYTIQDFLGTTTYIGASFAPDDSKILVSSNSSGIYNAWSVPLDGGEPTQLTQSTEESIFVRGYFPRDGRFLYESDQGGNELDHVYVRELDGSTNDLTPGDEHKATFLGWAWDEKTFYIATNERDPRFFDVYEHDIDSYAREMVFQNDNGFHFENEFPGRERRALVVSPDRRYIALTLFDSRNDTDIFLHDGRTGKTEKLTPHEGEIAYQAETFSPDGTKLYFLTDEDSEFRYLARMNLDGSGIEPVIQPDWDVWYAYFTRGGSHMIVGINRNASMEIQVLDAATMEPVESDRFAETGVRAVTLSRDGTKMAFYGGGSRAPGDLYAASLSEGKARQLTRSINPNIDPEDLVEGEVVSFTSFDGVEVPGILYTPHEATTANKVPALVWVHGGPGGQSRVLYNALAQYLVNHGYAVYEINNRGSSGYGKTFFRLDDRKHGEGDLDDCVASKQMLVDTGVIDPQRIGIIGGSYGGYMVLAAQAFRPGEFAVGVDIFGVSNWVRTLQSIPPWWESMRKMLEVEMGDFDNEAYFRSISPLFHVGRITAPMIVLQGANDPRVLKVESDEVVKALERNGVPVEYVVFDDEGHGFLKEENRERGYEAILSFLDKYLKTVGTAASSG